MRSTLLISTLLLSLNSYAFNDFEKALTSYNNNEVDESYIHLKNVLKNDEDNLPAIVLMGRVLLRKGLYKEGTEVLQEALFRGADINFLIDDLTSALMITNAYDEVIKLSTNKNLTKASQLTTFLLAGNAYSAMGDYDNARIYYKKSYATAPNNLRTISALAAHELQQENTQEAEKLIKKGISLFPKDSRIWNLKGQLHHNKAEYSLALKAYEMGYKVNSEDPFIQRALANAYANENKPEKALELVNNILNETPDDPFVKLLKSRLLAKTSREEESNQILVEISQKLSLLTDEQKNSNASLSLIAGTSAYLQNNLELAQTKLLYYVQEKPQDLSGISLLVDIYLNQGQQKKASELLEKKSEFIENNLELSLKLFELYLINNKIYKAEQVLNPLEKNYGKHLQFILAKVNLLSKKQQFTKALTLLNQNEPKSFSPVYYLTKGLVFKASKKTKEAHQIADKLLEVKPNNIDYLNFKSALLLEQNNWTLALETLEKITAQQPENFNALFNSATALSAQSKFKDAQIITNKLLLLQPENLSLKILGAKIDKDTGNFDKAKETLTEIIHKHSTHITALETLMELNYLQGDFQSALEQVNKLNKLSFLNSYYIKRKAQIYIELSDYEQAKKQLQLLAGIVATPREIYQLSQLQTAATDFSGAKKSLENALDIEPKNVVIQLTLTRLEIDLGNFISANKILKNLEKSNRFDPNVLMLRGDYHHKKGNKITAQKFYLQALKKDNNLHIVLLKLYRLASEKIGANEFSSTLFSLLNKNPKNHLMRLIYADYLLNTGKNEDARKHYEQLVNVDGLKNKASILNNLANIYISEDLIKAEEYSKKAIDLDNTSPAIIDTYGWILALNGKFNESLSTLRKAYSMDSNNPSINYHVGYTLIKLNRLDEAKRELTQAAHHNVNFSEREAAITLLNTL